MEVRGDTSLTAYFDPIAHADTLSLTKGAFTNQYTSASSNPLGDYGTLSWSATFDSRALRGHHRLTTIQYFPILTTSTQYTTSNGDSIYPTGTLSPTMLGCWNTHSYDTLLRLDPRAPLTITLRRGRSARCGGAWRSCGQRMVWTKKRIFAVKRQGPLIRATYAASACCMARRAAVKGMPMTKQQIVLRTMTTMLQHLSLVEIFGSFLVMFAIIDITGSIPIFLGMKEQGKTIRAGQATLVALGLFVVFFFAGEAVLRLFGIDIASFAVAGAFVLFVLALEMILGREIIRNESASSGASIVPIAFPLIAGPGALTALLSLRAEYHVVNIMIGLLLNIALDYLVLRYLHKLAKALGGDIVYVLRKFFGVILLAMAVKLFVSNIAIVIQGVQ